MLGGSRLRDHVVPAIHRHGGDQTMLISSPTADGRGRPIATGIQYSIIYIYLYNIYYIHNL